MNFLDNTLTGHHSNCFIPVLSTPEDVTMMAKMDQIPSMVVYMGKVDHVNSTGPYHGLLFEYSHWSPVITVTCRGLVRQGVLYALSHSLGPVNDICSMETKEIRISYNKASPLFAVNKEEVDSATIEGAVLDTFLKKYNLRPTFIHAKQLWGAKNEKTGLWNGIIGLVRVYFENTLYLSFRLATIRLILV